MYGGGLGLMGFGFMIVN